MTKKRRNKKIKEVARHLHPHDDEPDPTAYMGNYNSLKCFLLFALVLQPCLF